MNNTEQHGLYVHVPFCRSQCIYCDFSRIFKFDLVNEYIDAIRNEINIIPNHKPLKTIYLGGGTPSAIGAEALDSLLTIIRNSFDIKHLIEFTIECNPDDIDNEIVDVLKQHNINRISFGVQSLDDQVLKFMHRRHDSQRVYDSIELFRKNGFENISVDFIYGLPKIDNYNFEKDLHEFINLNISHLSAYSLSYETGSTITKMLNNGRIKEISDEENFEQYKTIICEMRKAGFDHYEVSNFARNNKYSRHNWLYWQREPYYGIGAAACSFDGTNRYSNASIVTDYIDAIKNKRKHFEVDTLTPIDIFNEIIMLGLRTKKGFSIDDLQFMQQEKIKELETKIAQNIANETIIKQNDNRFCIPEEKWFISDMIIRSLFA